MNSTQYSALIQVPVFHQFNVLGLTTIQRTLLALSKAGVGTACIVSDEAATIKAHLGNKIPDLGLQFFSKNEMEAARKSIVAQSPKAVFLFNEPLVVDISVLQDLMKSPTEGSNTCTLGGEVSLLQLADFQSDGKRGPVQPMVVGNHNCHPVRSKEELREVKKRMISNLTKPTDGWVSRKLNRPISTLVSRVLAYTPTTPNHVTIVNGLFAFSACYFMYLGGYWNWLIAGAIIHLASVLDGVDGELARLKFKHSKFGQSLDTFFDYSSALVALICLTIGVQRAGWPNFFFQAGVASGIFAVVAIGSLTIYVLRRGTDGAFNNIGYAYKGKDTTFSKVIDFMGVFTKRELYNFIFFLFGVFGIMPWTLVYVAIMALGVAVFAVQANFYLPKK